MNKSVVTFYYQGYRLLIFYLFNIFWAIPYQFNEFVLYSREGVTIINKGTGSRSGMEK